MISFIFLAVSIFLALCTVAFTVQAVKTHIQIKRLMKRADAYQTLSRANDLPSTDGSPRAPLVPSGAPSDSESSGQTETGPFAAKSQTAQTRPANDDSTVVGETVAKIGQTVQQSEIYGRSIKLPRKNIVEQRNRELTHA